MHNCLASREQMFIQCIFSVKYLTMSISVEMLIFSGL